MKVLIVFAHPEPQSLNTALLNIAKQTLLDEGHDVKVSNLYTMGWKPQIDRDDFLNLEETARLKPAAASGNAFYENALTDDVKKEQEKLLWADTLILHFPLWWFTMPAILKGWVDRVYAYGFGYGVGEHSDKRWGDRYGDGTFAGKRAMLIVTTGGWAEHYGPRGINGPIDDLLFPINHGILYYPGFDVLPAFVVYGADRLDDKGFDRVSDALRERMRELETAQPIPYHRQNSGAYAIPTLRLNDGLEAPGTRGFSLHLRQQE